MVDWAVAGVDFEDVRRKDLKVGQEVFIDRLDKTNRIEGPFIVDEVCGEVVILSLPGKPDNWGMYYDDDFLIKLP